MQLEDISASYTEAGYQQVELKSTLQAFWNTCSTDQQEVLTMYYADGLTLAEIAKITGKNLNTLKYQFYKVHDEALKMLPVEADSAVRTGVPA